MLFAGLEEPRHVVTKAAVALFRAISGAPVPPQAMRLAVPKRSPIMLAPSLPAPRTGRDPAPPSGICRGGGTEPDSPVALVAQRVDGVEGEGEPD
jgi:hypothetical protein